MSRRPSCDVVPGSGAETNDDLCASERWREGATPGNLSRVADELGMRIDAFQRCIEERDRAVAEELLDDDFELQLVLPTPASMPRVRWLEVLDAYVVHSYEVQERIVSTDGDCAVVLHRARMEATVLGADRSGIFVISDVWRRRDGAWRIWRRHSTPQGAGAMPGTT